jgi:heat shock protein HtpX
MSRKAGLRARMAVVLAAIVVTLGSAAAGMAALFLALPTWWPLWSAISVGLVATVVREYRAVETTMLSVAEASLVDRRQAPEWHELVARVAGMLDVPEPDIALAESGIPNGFVVGRRRAKSVVGVSSEMWRRLDRSELEAVLAHELSHVANRDAAVMTVANLPRVIGLELFASESDWFVLWYFLWPVGFLLYAWGSFLTRTLSRYREYAADEGSALATGRPEALMSALQKLADGIERIPREDLRRVEGLNPLFIVSVARARSFELLMDHPPLERRLARLASIAREMGRHPH